MKIIITTNNTTNNIMNLIWIKIIKKIPIIYLVNNENIMLNLK